MTALDVSLKALEVARRNIGFYRLRERIRLVKSDLFSSVKWGKTGLFDVIVSNPPYIPEKDLAGLPREVQFDPRLALNGGLRGLEIIDRILKDAPTFLKKDGWLLMEIGEKQAARVKKTALQTNNFKNIRFVKDLNGVERVFVGQRI